MALDGEWLQYLAKHKGPVSASELCHACGCSPDFMVRIMRILILNNIVDETGIEEYSANDTTHYMVGKAILDSMKYVYPLQVPSFSQIHQWAKDNGYEEPKSVENSPFTSVYNKTFFQVLEDNHRANSAFTYSMDFYYDEGMTKRDAEFVHNDLTKTTPHNNDAVTLVDIGGGSGAFVRTFRTLFPEHEGRLITQDRPSVTEAGRASYSQARVEFQASDFFAPQPVKGKL